MAKILVSVDDRLLSRIDKAAQARGLSRSAYLALLASRDLGTDVGPGRNASARNALRRLDRLFRDQPVDVGTTAAVRADRDER